MRSTLSLFAMLILALPASAQFGDLGDFKVRKKEDKEDVKLATPPEGAIVLFDGKNLDGWVSRNDPKKPAGWKLVDGGAMEIKPGSGDIITEKKFDGSFKLHVEFRTPYQPKDSGQGRGNSGVYVQGRYEVQVLDSYLVEKPGEGDCGGIYGIAKPLQNACKAPTIWQSYDIEFHSPKCVDGKKSEPGTISVVHNGFKIHDKVKITKDVTTSGLASDPCTPGPILLQDHGNVVQYRNIWLLPTK
jgi:hypothetical protein